MLLDERKQLPEDAAIIEPEILDDTAKIPAEKTAPREITPLPYPLTAQKLFRLARCLPDPARRSLGFFYESQLKRECEFLLRMPLYRHDVWGFLAAWNRLQAGTGIFLCHAISAVMFMYLEAQKNKEEF